MPVLELTNDELVVHLSAWEVAAALHTSIRVPLANVRGAIEDDGFRGREIHCVRSAPPSPGCP